MLLLSDDYLIQYNFILFGKDKKKTLLAGNSSASIIQIILINSMFQTTTL